METLFLLVCRFSIARAPRVDGEPSGRSVLEFLRAQLFTQLVANNIQFDSDESRDLVLFAGARLELHLALDRLILGDGAQINKALSVKVVIS